MDQFASEDGTPVEAADGVYLTPMAAGEEMSLQHLRIEPGARVPEHDHHHEQVGFVYRGVQTFVVDGEAFDVAAGDSYHIPGGEPHAAENRGEETMLAVDVFSPPRDDDFWSE